MNNKKLTILFYSYQHLDFNKGGLQNQFYFTKSALESRGHSVVMLDDWLINKQEVDICHQFSVHPTLINTFNELKARNNKIIISTIYNEINPSLITRVAINLTRFGIPILGYNSIFNMLKNADDLISLGSIETNTLNKLVNVNRIINIPNGISENFLSFKIDNTEKMDYIVCVGTICKRKNQLNLIKACKELGEKLLLIGPDSTNEKEYVELCKDQSNEDIKFLGYIDSQSEKFMNILAGAKIFVLASVREVLPISVFESLALGTPVCCTKNATVNDYINDHISFCDPSSIESIKNNILKIINDEIKIDYVKHIRNRYSWANVAEQIEKIYYNRLDI